MTGRSLKVGVTGGIGAGKTTICNIFGVLGVPVYNADERAKMLMIEDQDVIESIKINFGVEAYLPGGALNRTYLSSHVFQDETKRNAINEIVHPAVGRDFEKWAQHHQEKSYILKEAALLVESGSHQNLDHLITIIAPVDLRIKRALTRDGHRTKELVQQIISSQSSDKEKVAKSSFVIRNDDRSLVIPQVLQIHQFLISLAHTG